LGSASITTDRAERLAGPWYTASTLLPSRSRTLRRSNQGFPRQLSPHSREHDAVEALGRIEIRDAHVRMVKESASMELH
jgi:hypothetical protein